MQAGWFTPTLISLNEVRWEICAMCRFGKLSVTNAAATLPPSHMFPLFPVLKKTNSLQSKTPESYCLIHCFPAREKPRVADTSWMLLVLVVQNGTIITRFCLFVPRPCWICFHISLCSKRKKQTNAELFPRAATTVGRIWITVGWD